jgi:hypothetical protein
MPLQVDIKEKSACFFCKKKDMKKESIKFQKWLEKKGISISFVCYESNMVDVNYNTVYISNTLQGMRNLRKPMGNKQNIYSGNKMCSHVKAIETCYLILGNGFDLDLEMTFYVPSFSRNLILVSRIVLFGYFIKFSETFSLFYKSDCVGNDILYDGFIALLYKIMSLIVQYMFTLTLKDALLTRILLVMAPEIRTYLHREN